MALVNEHFLKLPGSYLFSDIAKKVNTFKITHPKQDIIRLGIGDVTQPLPKACIEAMHKAVEELASKDTLHSGDSRQTDRHCLPLLPEQSDRDDTDQTGTKKVGRLCIGK